MEDIKKWREITLTLVSADSLPDVRKLGRMKVYGSVWVVCLGGKTMDTNCFLHSSTDTVLSFGSKNMEDAIARSSFLFTPTDTQGETNPKWNFPMKCVISESELCRTENMITCLLVFLFCKRSFGSDKPVGHAIIPLKDLIDHHASTRQLFGNDLDPNGGTVTIFVDNIRECSELPTKPDAPPLPAHSNLEKVNNVLEIVLKLVQAATDVLPKIIVAMQ